MAIEVFKKFNVALIGHGGSGKTTFSEAVLYALGLTTRMGRVEDGNTVSDYTPEEIKRHHSIATTVLPISYQGCHVNILDVPGYLDFVGEMVSSLSVVEGTFIFVNASAGIESQTYRAWTYSRERALPSGFIISQMDKENTDFVKLVNSIKDSFGNKCVPIFAPYYSGGKLTGLIDLISKQGISRESGKSTSFEVPTNILESVEQLRFNLIEAIVEQDDTLFEKYLAEEEIPEEGLRKALRKGVCSCEIFPIFCISALNFIGIEPTIDAIVNYFPSADERGNITGVDPNTKKPAERPLIPEAPFCGRVFKIVNEPHVGELSYIRIYSGKLRPGETLYNSTTQETEKISAIAHMRGKERKDLTEASAGDIIATVKLKNTHVGDTLCAKELPILLDRIIYPRPVSFEAIEVEDKSVLEKVSTALNKVHEEDPTLLVEMNEETRQLVVYGMGELHLQVVRDKIAERYGAKIEWTKPRIPYKETITGTAQAQGKYKKQTGGRGQYGDVWLRLEPYSEGNFNFIDKVVGGVVPSRFIPAVEKGVLETMANGVLAGYPVTGVQVTLYDGSHHSVDSSELAFKIAASMGFKKAFNEAKPILLEPIYQLKIYIPEQFVGDVMGDLNSRRGRVQKSSPLGTANMQVIEALVPLAEVYKYINTLRSITQGLGSYEMEFSHYEEVPPQIAKSIIAGAKREYEIEE